MKNSLASEIQEKLQEIVEEYQPEYNIKTVPFRVIPKTDEFRKTG
jgi:hypothetical protein